MRRRRRGLIQLWIENLYRRRSKSRLKIDSFKYKKKIAKIVGL
jgi:hypothetical protein